MKKSLLYFFIALSMIFFVGCQNKLDGFWMDDNGNTLTFGKDGELVINNEIYVEYSISDGNLIIKSDEISDILPLSSSITETNDVLILKDQKSQNIYVFYGNEDNQTECRYISGQKEIPEDLYHAALDIFKEKIVPRYEESYDCDFAYFNYGAARIDGNICYGIEMRTNQLNSDISNMLGIYFVNIDTNDVYWYDYLNQNIYINTDDLFTCEEILNNEIAPIYSEYYKEYDGSFAYSLKTNEDIFVQIDGERFFKYEAGISTEEDYFHMDDFAINPQTGEIYWYDVYQLYDGDYHKWNGKIANGHQY
ncbi:MAG: hypothetical protein IJC82_02990 [Firmicutes bacterium]|nr:hypothetical protein [Bacillota bacterium]